MKKRQTYVQGISNLETCSRLLIEVVYSLYIRCIHLKEEETGYRVMVGVLCKGQFLAAAILDEEATVDGLCTHPFYPNVSHSSHLYLDQGKDLPFL